MVCHYAVNVLSSTLYNLYFMIFRNRDENQLSAILKYVWNIMKHIFCH